MPPTKPSSPTPSTRALRSVAIVESHHEGLKYLAWAKRKSVRQLVGRAIKRFLETEGIYLSAQMLRECPICDEPLTAETVAQDLFKRRIWVCGACRRAINKEIDRRAAARAKLPPCRLVRPGE